MARKRFASAFRGTKPDSTEKTKVTRMIEKDEPEYVTAMEMAKACHGNEATFPKDEFKEKFPLCSLLGIQLRQFEPGEYFVPPREVVGVTVQEIDPNGKKHTFALTSGGPMPLRLVVEENANGMIASEKIKGLLSPTWHDLDTLFLDSGTTLAQAKKALKAKIKDCIKRTDENEKAAIAYAKDEASKYRGQYRDAFSAIVK